MERVRFSYEWDFITTDYGYVGLVLDLKYTDVEAALTNSLIGQRIRARAPIPAIGGTGRVYVVPNVSITGEFTMFRLPEGIDEDYRARYYDFDLYGTVNFTDIAGVQVGHRSMSVFYEIDRDSGDHEDGALLFWRGSASSRPTPPRSSPTRQETARRLPASTSDGRKPDEAVMRSGTASAPGAIGISIRCSSPAAIVSTSPIHGSRASRFSTGALRSVRTTERRPERAERPRSNRGSHPPRTPAALASCDRP